MLTTEVQVLLLEKASGERGWVWGGRRWGCAGLLLKADDATSLGICGDVHSPWGWEDAAASTVGAVSGPWEPTLVSCPREILAVCFCDAESLFTRKQLERSSKVNGGFGGISLVSFPSGTASPPPQKPDLAAMRPGTLVQFGGLWPPGIPLWPPWVLLPRRTWQRMWMVRWEPALSSRSLKEGPGCTTGMATPPGHPEAVGSRAADPQEKVAPPTAASPVYPGSGARQMRVLI